MSEIELLRALRAETERRAADLLASYDRDLAAWLACHDDPAEAAAVRADHAARTAEVRRSLREVRREHQAAEAAAGMRGEL